jgi:hypothetical protein
MFMRCDGLLDKNAFYTVAINSLCLIEFQLAIDDAGEGLAGGVDSVCHQVR